ncbi:hypothetical protein AB1Y20_004185 [Prymnesium parvum]|uniref:Uncharacterized protein n=1 Tax=Prymnesium parvum TaxID=97485 RepID=A0AB34J609_PRYPA|mmetsp:Transcript_37627/g.91580  ORF Transcript_37627/g.91580 Transcript_37627/m.91580 type:complete len:446 (-) Transcript_37627:403-1740(-)
MKRGVSIYRPKPSAVERIVHHQFSLVPIKPNSVDLLLALLNSDEVATKLKSLKGLNDIEVYVSGDVTDSPVAVLHACFLEQATMLDAAQTVKGVMASLSGLVAGEPQLLPGKSVWRAVGSSVLDSVVGSSYCRLTTVPLQKGNVDFLVGCLNKPITKALIPSLEGLVGLECVQSGGLLLMASIFQDAASANVADEVLTSLLDPIFSQWWAAGDFKTASFEGTLLWSAGSQSFTQAASFVHLKPLRAKPGTLDTLVKELEAVRDTLTDQHGNGLVSFSLVETSERGGLLAVSGWRGLSAATEAKAVMSKAMAGAFQHLAESPEESATVGAVFWRWEGEAVLQTPGYLRVSSAPVNGEHISDWVIRLHENREIVSYLEGLVVLELLLVESNGGNEVVFKELYTSAGSAIAASSCIQTLAANSAPEGLIIGDVLLVQNGPIHFFHGLA